MDEQPVMCTFSGRVINPLNLRPSDLCIQDIAHHLSLINRFNGASKEPISVAQHSVHVADLCRGKPCELQALLHDGSETYLGDVTRWLKKDPAMSLYREAEKRAQTTIYAHFGCDTEEAPEVEDADRFMVRFEMHHGFGGRLTVGGLRPDAQHDFPRITAEELVRFPDWEPWGWKEARRRFLERFHLLHDYGNDPLSYLTEERNRRCI